VLVTAVLTLAALVAAWSDTLAPGRSAASRAPTEAASGPVPTTVARPRAVTSPSPPTSPPSGFFRRLTSQMWAPRDLPTLTLLADGRVLVLGDHFGGNRSAEIWDPISELFTPTDRPDEPRTGPTATLLVDGRVLVSGGTESPRPDEIWDPATESFGPAGQTSAPRASALPAPDEGGRSDRDGVIRIALSDGRVLVAGGFAPLQSDSRTRCLDEAAVWDPDGRLSTPIDSLEVARAHAAAVLLRDGRVLVVGNHFSCSLGTTAELLEWQ
jgi:hypothetical protein